ncbi:MAG: efflux RND transporter periplasmic adaptor subunit [Planctomycetaceae bacterium]
MAIFSRIARCIRRHFGKLIVLIVVIAGAATVWAIPSWRAEAQAYWVQALAWAGLATAAEEGGTIYWCPMHPQIKRTRPNDVCPICNMALVPLEGNGAGIAPEELTLTPRQIQQAGVVYEPVVPRKLYREIDTTGRVDYDERRLAGITSWIRGKSRIQKLHVNFTGTRVDRGELMAELYSPELITAQKEYVVALEALDSVRGRRNDRTPGGLDPALGPRSLIDAARDKLRYWGMSREQIDRLAEMREVQESVPIHAPIGGTVIERQVQEGQYVAEGDWLFRLAELSRLWLYVDIYEEELPLVEPGQTATIHVRGLPEESFEGTVSFVPPEIERDTRTARVRIDVDNPAGLLKPGMYAEVRLRKELGKKLAVPASAVLWSGQRRVAIVHAGNGRFSPREIRIDTSWSYPSEPAYRPCVGLAFGGERERFHHVLDGLAAGEEVVTSAAFLLNAESQFQSVLTKMLPPESWSATLEEAVGEPIAHAIRGMLEAYFKLVAALADDQIDAVAKHARLLRERATTLAGEAATAEMPELSAQAERLADMRMATGVTSNDRRMR